MWVAYVFIGYLVLAVAIPLAWSLAPVWRNANAARCIRCPELSKPVTIRLDAWHAVRMRALGNPELRLRDCTEWPQRAGCSRECLSKIGAGT